MVTAASWISEGYPESGPVAASGCEGTVLACSLFLRGVSWREALYVEERAARTAVSAPEGASILSLAAVLSSSAISICLGGSRRGSFIQIAAVR